MSLFIQLLGSFAVIKENQPLTLSRAKKIEALLAYLARHPQQHTREQLTHLLFPELPDKAARANLRQTLKRLRVWLGEAEPEFLLITTDWVQLNPTAVWHTDYQKAQQLLTGCPIHASQPIIACPDCITNLQEGFAHYQAPLLDGFFITNSEPFEQWLQAKQQRYQQQVRHAGEMLASYYEQRGAYAKAEAILYHLISLEPWRDALYPQLMRLLAWQGKRGAALQVYKQGGVALMEELGVEPSTEMTEWAEKVQQQPEKRPFHLPPLPTRSFLGRQQLQEDIRAMLLQQRLVTLWGVGGVGKTQLALHIGWSVAQMNWGPFMDGIYWLTITEQHTPNQLHTELGAWLGLSGSTINDKPALLILDNSELLPDPSINWLGELLKQSQHITCLVTSRERLQLSLEWGVEVAGLPYPEVHPQQMPSSHLPESTYSAMTLFYERARQVNADFAPEPTAVARICQLTEGLPLALELASAWVQSLTCTQIAEEIEASLAILQTTQRDTLPRHRSIQAVFEASWARLSATEQDGLRRLRVFNGRFDHQAAKAIINIGYPILSQLINKSLLQSQPPYFELHSLLHQFLQDKAGNLEETKTKLAYYYGALLNGYEKTLHTIEMPKLLADIQAQIGNIRQGWQWAIDTKNLWLIEQYAPTLYQFYALRSWHYEGRDMFQKACALRHNLPSKETPLLFTHLLTRLAQFEHSLGHLKEAEALLQESLAIGNLVEDSTELALLYKKSGMITYQRGDYLMAQKHLQLSIQILQEAHNQASYAHTLMSMGVVLQAQGELQKAQESLQESLTIYQQLNHTWGQAHVARLLGQLMQAQENWKAAQQFYQRSLVAVDTLDDPVSKALTLDGLGQLAHQKQQFAKAQQRYTEAVQLLEPLSDQRGLMRVWHHWAQLTAVQQQYPITAQQYTKALDIATQLQDLPYILQLLTDIALLGYTKKIAEPTALEILSQLYYHPACSKPLKQKILSFVALQKVTYPSRQHSFSYIQEQTQQLLEAIKQHQHKTNEANK